MSYTITDKHHKILIRFNEEIPSAPNLRVYINNGTTPALTYGYQASIKGYKINTRMFEVGDEITKLEIVQTSSTDLWNTQESVLVLLNGNVVPVGKVTSSGGVDTLVKDTNGNIVYVDHLSNNKFYLNLTQSGDYDIQAVFCGNNKLEMSATTKEHFKLEQPVPSGGSEDGEYVLDFVDPTTPTLTYKDANSIQFKLTRGGNPVSGKLIQVTHGDYDVASVVTDANGIVTAYNHSWRVGKYKIGAYHLDNVSGKIIASAYRNVTVKKGTPSWTDNSEAHPTFHKGDRYVMHLAYRGDAMTGEKVILYVNGKKTTRTTSSTGSINYPFKSKGTFKFKAVYTGNNNLNKAQKSKTITVS